MQYIEADNLFAYFQVRLSVYRIRVNVCACVSGYTCRLILYMYKIRNSADHLTFTNNVILV